MQDNVLPLFVSEEAVGAVESTLYVDEHFVSDVFPALSVAFTHNLVALAKLLFVADVYDVDGVQDVEVVVQYLAEASPLYVSEIVYLYLAEAYQPLPLVPKVDVPFKVGTVLSTLYESEHTTPEALSATSVT